MTYQSGMVPESLLYDKPMYVMFGMLSKVRGMVPVNWFELKYKSCSDVKCVNVSGIMPVI